MSEKAEKLKAALAELTPEEREDIRDYFDGLEDKELSREEWEEHWVEECNRRMADLEAGRTHLIPGDEVSRKMREKYG